MKLASSGARRIAATRPSIMSEGAMISMPERVSETAARARSFRLASLSISNPACASLPLTKPGTPPLSALFSLPELLLPLAEWPPRLTISPPAPAARSRNARAPCIRIGRRPPSVPDPVLRALSRVPPAAQFRPPPTPLSPRRPFFLEVRIKSPTVPPAGTNCARLLDGFIYRDPSRMAPTHRGLESHRCGHSGKVRRDSRRRADHDRWPASWRAEGGRPYFYPVVR